MYIDEHGTLGSILALKKFQTIGFSCHMSDICDINHIKTVGFMPIYNA